MVSYCEVVRWGLCHPFGVLDTTPPARAQEVRRVDVIGFGDWLLADHGGLTEPRFACVAAIAEAAQWRRVLAGHE